MKIVNQEFGTFSIPNNDANWTLPFESVIEKDLIKDFTHIIIYGSNYGTLELFICHCNPAISIYTFEPRDAHFCLLRKNIDDNKIENVILLNNALGHMCGDVSLPRNLLQASNIEFDHNEIISIGNGHLVGFNNQYNFVTIDSLNLIACNMIFIDLNGFEYITLAGAIRTIQKFKPILCFNKTCKQSEINAFFGIHGKIEDLISSLEYKVNNIEDFVIANHMA